jgi:hypothetical protein
VAWSVLALSGFAWQGGFRQGVDYEFSGDECRGWCVTCKKAKERGCDATRVEWCERCGELVERPDIDQYVIDGSKIWICDACWDRETAEPEEMEAAYV